MNSVLRQLQQWRLREAGIRLAWGGARWFAIIATVLAIACTIDWIFDRYSGSPGWRKAVKWTRVLAPSDPLAVGHTPIGLRLLMSAAELALAGFIAYRFIVKPLQGTPSLDELAGEAEKAHPEFDHRLVTAIQLNRPSADTRGMSQGLIKEVTREAGEIAAKYNLLSLISYRRLMWAAVAFLPMFAAWAAFYGVNPPLTTALVKRQLMPWADIEIPRDTRLENVTPKDVWLAGTDVIIRYKVTGRSHGTMEGILRIVPFDSELGVKFDPEKTLTIAEVKEDGAAKKAGLQAGDVIQKIDGDEVKDETKYNDRIMRKKPGDKVKITVKRGDATIEREVEMTGQTHPEEFYPLVFESRPDDEDAAYFVAKLPASTTNFQYQARLGDGRTKTPGEVFFVSPPQLGREDSTNRPLTTLQILPTYLGTDPEGQSYTRLGDGWERGEVIDALPQSAVLVSARFNKPVEMAMLVPIERVGLQEHELQPIPAATLSANKKNATFIFATTPRMIGYRLELKDLLGFKNQGPIRRNVRMWEDRPPVVEFKPESTRNPNPDAFDGQGNPKDYEWDMALGPDGLVMVIFNARSEVGIKAANIRYRVIPKGVQFDTYPEDYKAIQHPRDDPNLIVYDRLPLKRVVLNAKNPDPGPFNTDLGLFLYSFTRSVEFFSFEIFVDVVPRFNRNRVNVEFYPLPSRNPRDEPGELEAGGRINFEVSGLEKKIPDVSSDGKTTLRRAKLEVGDTVEVYLEVYDKLPVVDANGKPLLGPDGKPLPARVAGYTREAKRKIAVSESDAALAMLARDEARMKLRDKLDQLAQDQLGVFRPKKK